MMLYLDLDGVMVDFERGLENLRHHESKGAMWKEIKRTPNWFLGLKPKKDYWELWDWLQGKYDITILTALPRYMPQEADADKREWVRKYLSNTVRVTTCFGIEKQDYAMGYNILIDDSGRNIGQWINQGGIGILHRDAKTTIEILKELNNELS